MEQNLWNALHCDSTLTELAVLAIYAEAISYPYMKAIRQSQEKTQNMLDLGPFHHKVYQHMQKIINNVDILIGESASAATGSLSGEEWENPAVVAEVIQHSLTLPSFQEMLIEFFHGAAGTWERFTSEFTPGGLIDEATAEEQDLAYMPATNDENKGELGTFRQLIH